MNSSILSAIADPPAIWPDSRLVRECLIGNEEAWPALVEKYKRLIYSIPVKYGLTTEDAADIFQSVCVGALSRLETLREPGALPKWLMYRAAHESYRAKLLQSRAMPEPVPPDTAPPEPVRLDEDGEQSAPPGPLPPDAERILLEAQQEQALREAVAALTPRCARLVQALFFVEPAIPYKDVAKLLGLATDSVGFLRGRCLTKLRKELERASNSD